MNIDFHYGVIYITARLAGMSSAQAKTVAHSCQYVDDATTPGVLHFSGGESFDRFASAHKMFDYRNALQRDTRVVWAPFHFLPACIGDTLDEKSICRPNSDVAKEMARRAINARNANNALHRLGVTLHVYVDTWAHKGFSGTISQNNTVTKLEGDDHTHETWKAKLKGYLEEAEENAEAHFLDKVSGLGHGAALHFPDMPWAKWKYTNGNGFEIDRNNLPDFLEAADMACRAIRGFLTGNTRYETLPGLSDDQKESLGNLMSNNRDHDERIRLDKVMAAFAAGEIVGFQETIPPYIDKGIGSWKYLATGISDVGDGSDEPAWSEIFEESDYRKVHDAIKEHRFVVTQEILPKHGVRLA